MKTELDAAWQTWRDGVESLRALLLAQEWIGLPGAHASALNCADFIYRFAFLDGARVYRIRGRRGTTCWADMFANEVLPHFRRS